LFKNEAAPAVINLQPQNLGITTADALGYEVIIDPIQVRAEDIGEVKRAGENMLYNRAYNYLINIDVQDEYHVRILFEEANSKLEEALQKTLFFFENEEEYEKCAILKRYLDFLNFSS